MNDPQRGGKTYAYRRGAASLTQLIKSAIDPKTWR
jgi:hypothetical protein